MKTKTAVFLVSGMLVSSPVFAETVELVTYYPAPGGGNVETDRLRASRGTVGDAYSLINPADADLQEGTLLVGSRVAIGPGFGGVPLTQALEVQGNLLSVPPAGAPALFMADRSTAASLNGLQLLTNGVQQWTIGSPADGTENLQIFNNVDNAVRFFVQQGTGNVGIGTGAPNSLLDVRGSMSLGVTVATANLALTEAHNVVLTNGAGNITITLPAAANRTGRTYYIKKTDGDTDTVTINAAGGALIDGAASLVLYVQGDAVRLVTDGFNWFGISDEIQPHTARMIRSTVQSIPSTSTYVKINLNYEDYDIGNIADPAGGRFVIRRAGTYLVVASWYFAPAALPVYLDTTISVNGVLVTYGRSSPYSAPDVTTFVTDVLRLNPGDVIEMVVYQASGSAHDTSLFILNNLGRDLDMRPRMTVTEIRY